jgi:ribose transport system substrate-binding protein
MKHLVNNGEISYCAGESEKAKTIAAQMINENPDLRVLYATNERSTIGVCEAVKEAKEEGRISKEKENLIMVIGFNANSTEVDFIQNDILTGTILQNPYNMGYLGVMNAGNYLSDGSAHGKVDTGVVYVNKKNLTNNDVRLLLDPQNYIKNYIKD